MIKVSPTKIANTLNKNNYTEKRHTNNVVFKGCSNAATIHIGSALHIAPPQIHGHASTPAGKGFKLPSWNDLKNLFKGLFSENAKSVPTSHFVDKFSVGGKTRSVEYFVTGEKTNPRKLLSNFNFNPEDYPYVMVTAKPDKITADCYKYVPNNEKGGFNRRIALRQEFLNGELTSYRFDPHGHVFSVV